VWPYSVYFPSAFIHIFQRLWCARKHSWKSVSDCHFSMAVTFLSMSSIRFKIKLLLLGLQFWEHDKVFLGEIDSDTSGQKLSYETSCVGKGTVMLVDPLVRWKTLQYTVVIVENRTLFASLFWRKKFIMQNSFLIRNANLYYLELRFLQEQSFLCEFFKWELWRFVSRSYWVTPGLIIC
jgi:hypothetical protein